MADAFLRSHGIDIGTEMSKIQFGDIQNEDQTSLLFQNASLPGKPRGSTWNVLIKDGHIIRIEGHDREKSHRADNCGRVVDAKGSLLASSLCHPHVHLDKAYLLSHPMHCALQVSKGDFQEALELTEAAKSQFTHEDLIERGQRVIDESISAGVTHMRAFVEVDAGVGIKCLDAGAVLKRRAEKEGKCAIQICAFAQRPIFSSAPDDEDGSIIRGLLHQVAGHAEVAVIGSTPYVEKEVEQMKRNIAWLVSLSIEFNLHLDFHLDYNLDANAAPLIWTVLDELKRQQWMARTTERTVMVGHCTRLMLFSPHEWGKLTREIRDSELPIYFVGLPTSDLYMMRSSNTPEVRGTLDVPRMIKEHKINACLGINNIGNAFTPHGTCDPLSLATQGVSLYQAGSQYDAELLYECVSTRAKAAIGFIPKVENRDPSTSSVITIGSKADLVLYDGTSLPADDWRRRKTLVDAVCLYDHGLHRRCYSNGRPTSL